MTTATVLEVAHARSLLAELTRRSATAPSNLHRVETGTHAPSMTTVARLSVTPGVSLERPPRSQDR